MQSQDNSAFVGLDGAIAKLRRSIEARADEQIVAAVSQALVCVAALSRALEPEATDASSDGARLVAGLLWAHDHDLRGLLGIDAVRSDPSFPATFPASFEHLVVWRDNDRLSAQPPIDPAGLDAYRALVVHHVLGTLVRAHEYLDRRKTRRADG